MYYRIDSEFKNIILDRFVNKNTDKTPINENKDADDNTIEQPINNNIMENIDEKEDDSIAFKYLDDDDLSLITHDRDYLKEYNIHLCCYMIDQSCRLPFPKYLLQNKNNLYSFPNTKLDMKPFIMIKQNQHLFHSTSEIIISDENTQNPKNPKENDSNDINDEFLKQVQDLFTNTFGKPFGKTNYKGFLEENNTICVFFDISSLELETNPFEFCIIDEIINKGAIKGTFIQTEPKSIFQNNSILHTLRTCENIALQYPKIGYIVEKSENDTHNKFFDEEKRQTKLIIYPSPSYKDQIDSYLFSADPLSPMNIKKIRKFACFVENFDEETNINDEKTFTFEENNNLIYGISEEDLFVEL